VATSPLQSFGIIRGLPRIPVPRTPRRTSARYPGGFGECGVPGSLPALSRGPDSKSSIEHPPRFLARPERSSGRQLPGLRPVLRVCTHSLRAGSVHLRRLSWGSCPPVLGAGRPAHHRLRSTWTVIHARRAADGCRILPVRRISPPAATGGLPFKAFTPTGWVPVARSLPSCSSRAGAPPPFRVRFRALSPGRIPRGLGEPPGAFLGFPSGVLSSAAPAPVCPPGAILLRASCPAARRHAKPGALESRAAAESAGRFRLPTPMGFATREGR
jgi:hypothetical protein